MRDKPIRSLTKTISWRFIATLTTMTLIYIFTKNIFIVASIGVLEIVSKMTIYYLHERAWNAILWGTTK